jgi:hypothetical protein
MSTLYVTSLGFFDRRYKLASYSHAKGGSTTPEFFGTDEALLWSLMNKIESGDRSERARLLLVDLKQKRHASLSVD